MSPRHHFVRVNSLESAWQQRRLGVLIYRSRFGHVPEHAVPTETAGVLECNPRLNPNPFG